MTPAEFMLKVLADAESVVKSNQEIQKLNKNVEQVTGKLTDMETKLSSAMGAVGKKARSDTDAIANRIQQAVKQAEELTRLSERRHQTESADPMTAGSRGRLRQIELEISEAREKGNKALQDAKRIYDGTRQGDQERLVAMQQQQGLRISALKTERELLYLGLQQQESARNLQTYDQKVLATRDQQVARTRQIIDSIRAQGAIQRETQDDEERARARYQRLMQGGFIPLDGGSGTPVTRQLREAGRMFETVAGTAANSANRARFTMFQLTSAFQDIAIVLQNGGTFDRALLGAANNFGVMASTAAPLIAVLGTMAVIAIPTIVSALLKAEEVTETYTERTKKLVDQQGRLRDANMEVADSFRHIQRTRYEIEMGLGTKAEREGKSGLEGAISDIARERFTDPAMQQKAEEFFINREMEKIRNQETQRMRLQQSGVDTVTSQFGQDFFQRMQYAARGQNMAVPFEQSVRMFGLSGDVQKLLEVAGKEGPANVTDPLHGNMGGRFTREVERQMGITGGNAGSMGFGQGRTLMGRQYEMTPGAEANFRRMAVEAVEAASRDETKIPILGKVSKELAEAAKALAELRKKSEAEIAADTEKARAEGLGKAKGVIHGEDIAGLRSFMDSRDFAGIVGAAEKRESIKDVTRRQEVERRRANEEAADTARDRLSEMRERLAHMNERGAGPGSRELATQISILEQQEQRRARDVQMEEKRRQMVKDLSDLETSTVNRRKAARSLLGEPTSEILGMPSEKADKLQEDQLVSQRSIEGLMGQLVNLQDASTKYLQEMNERLEQIRKGQESETGARPPLNRN